MKELENAKMLHYVVRTKPIDKKPVFVTAINAINPFIKPGYNYVSVTVNKKNLEEFQQFLEKNLIEAYFYY